MGAKKRQVKRKEKKVKKKKKNVKELWVVEDGKVKRTHRECPRCGPGVYMAQHYSRYHCGKCGYTKFDRKRSTKKKGGRAAQRRTTGVRSPQRTRKKINK